MHKTILITGSSMGIGLALAKVFLSADYKVIGTCRTGTIDEIKDPNFEALALDLANPDSIKAFAQDFQSKQFTLDILVNNAGIGPDLDTDLPEEVSFRQTFEVNTTGTVFLTEQLCQYVKPNGKIINISSKMGSIDLCQGSDSVAYRMSKSALNMYTKILTNRFLGKQTVAAVHPGWVRTTISKSNIHGRLSAEESAQGLFDFIQSDFTTGTFWNVETQDECTW